MKKPNEVLRNENDDSGDWGGALGLDMGFSESEKVEESAASPTPPIDVAQVASSAALAALEASELRRANQPQPPTQEQIDEMLKVYKLTPETFQKIIGEDLTLEERMQAFSDVLNGVSRHAMTVAGLTARMAAEQVRNQFQPLLSAHEQKIHDDFVGNIGKTYPGLAGHKKVLDGIITQMKAEGYTPPAGPQGVVMAMQEVANRASALISQFQPGFDIKGSSHNQIQASGGLPAMSDGGAGGGAAGVAAGRQAQPSKKSWQAIFD